MVKPYIFFTSTVFSKWAFKNPKLSFFFQVTYVTFKVKKKYSKRNITRLPVAALWCYIQRFLHHLPGAKFSTLLLVKNPLKFI